MDITKNNILLATLCGVLSLPLSVYYVLSSQPENSGQTSEQSIKNKVKVTTITLTAGTNTPIIMAFGNVSSNEKLLLTGQVSGEVIWKSPNFKTGHLVKQGDVLLKIKDTTYRVALANAKKRLAEAHLALLQEQRKHSRALKEWEKSGISQEPTPLVLRKPQLEIAKANHIAAKEAVDEANINLARTQIITPFDAIVGEASTTKGSYISIGSTLGKIQATDLAEIQVSLSDSEWSQLPHELESTEVLIRSQGKHTHTWMAQATKLSEFIDPITRMRTLTLQVKSPLAQSPALLFGSFVAVEIKGKSYKNSFVIAPSSLTADGALWYVKNGKLHQFQPNFVFSSTDSIGIDRGAMETDIVLVLKPLSRFVDGMEVTSVAYQQEPNSEQ
ncbi:efflux RND transporter periplasmic adaptor subunit [Vibrio mediterranei]|uniref:efflux RND transporter periplasmic adaptor subunit n=1 Tax=Vibrio mediterranei TaxID=689 RepID=UPI00148D6BEC|nr:efflux RND transporter periplasmic adaptor subunit [Vibrio mediterranei]NOH31668.1 efflux RND transporter periplasmic adaptor subunit [Vibrio mediterranei]